MNTDALSRAARRILLATCLVLINPASAHALLILDYEGADFTNTSGTRYTLDMSVTARLVFEQTATGLSLTDQWHFFDGNDATLDGSNAKIEDFALELGGDGLPSFWNISVSSLGAVGDLTSLFMRIASSAVVDTTDCPLSNLAAYDCIQASAMGGVDRAGVLLYSNPGIWNAQVVEGTPVPEPSTLLLMGAGLLGLGWPKRRQTVAEALSIRTRAGAPQPLT